MEKITTSELEKMIKNKFIEKGVLENDITIEILNNISSKIKEEVNKNKPIEKTSSIDMKNDLNKLVPEKTVDSLENKQTNYSDENSYRDGKLDEREKQLAKKEAELIEREKELSLKENEVEYKPEFPESIENMGCEDFFIFNENQLSIGAEKLSNTEFNLVNSPEEKSTMKKIWLKDGKKEANVFKVNFEKIGYIKFEPFEGISSFENYSETDEVSSSLDKEAEYLANNPIMEPNENKTMIDIENKDLNFNISNVSDYIEPIKNVSQPLIKTDDIEIDLQRSNVENNFINSQDFQNSEIELENKVEEIIKKYLQKMF